ncbi:hypothetical protein M0805_003292 [Coniferiporia weirii]|nr:hypothetical protein M0805_003292 [Coniferiporia weirii]
MDMLFPSSYPLPPTNSGPTQTHTPVRLRVRSNTLRLRCRPGELYLGASSARGRVAFFSHADVRAYDESVVREWVGEVRDAAVFYLGGGAACERAEGDKSGPWSGIREPEGTQLRARL